MSQSKHERPNHAPLNFRRLLLLAVVVLMVFFALALAFILNGTEKWAALGFKIFELSAQMVLVAVLGGALVQAYIKWHARQSTMNEFRKATAEAVIREYSAAKKVRRLLRANCIQGPAGDKDNPWTDVPVTTYDTHIGTLNDVQLALELLKRRLKFFRAVFQNPNDLSLKADAMEKYLGQIITEYEQRRNPKLERDSIPLGELDRLRGFIWKDKGSDFDSFGDPFDDLLRLLETEGVWVAV
jgi:hypothetical protein